LVGVAQALFELEHGLTHRLEAEVPGLDDSCVHRPDRYFVDAAALRQQEAVLVVARGLRLRPPGAGEIPAQWKLRVLPSLVASPAAHVRMVRKGHSQHVADVALGAVSTEIRRRVRCQDGAGARHHRTRDQVGAGLLETGIDANRPAALLADGGARACVRAHVLTPARDPATAPGIGFGAEPAPVPGMNLDELRRREPGRHLRLHAQADLRETGQKRRERAALRHSGEAPVMSTVACSNQRERKLGIASPSKSTSSRCTTTGSMLASTGFCPGGGSPKTIFCMWRNSPAKATPKPTSSGIVSHGQDFMVSINSRNSLMKTPKGGKPAIETVPSKSPQPIAGWVRMRPRMRSMRCVPASWQACPTVTK